MSVSAAGSSFFTRSALGGTALLVVHSWSARAPAEPAEGAAESTVVSIRYDAPRDCPSQTEFLAQVSRRLSHVRIADTGGERHFEVRVDSVTGGVRARLEFVDSEARRVQRVLIGRDCAEAVSGVALVTALTIDPRLSLAGSESEVYDTPAPVPAPVVPPAAPRRRSKVPAPRPLAARSPEQDAVVPVEQEPAAAWTWLAGAGVGAVSDVAPVWTPAAEAFTELGFGRHWRTRATVGYADTGERDSDGAATRFRLIHGRGELCPVGASLGGGLTLRPCAALELGSFQAQGLRSSRLAQPKSSNALWFSGLAALRAELDLGHRFSLELQGQLRVPFLRRRYVYERPTQLAYETPGLGAGALVGARAVIAD